MFFAFISAVHVHRSFKVYVDTFQRYYSEQLKFDSLLQEFSTGIMDVNDNNVNNNNVADREGNIATLEEFDKLGLGSSPRPKTDISSDELQNLNAPKDETSWTLEDSDPSERRGAKKDSLSYSEQDPIKELPTHQSDTKPQMKPVLYDSQGVLLHNQLDLCDCLRAACPGCHFPCPTCQSPKCGHDCRNNRDWEYTCVEVESSDGDAFRDNKFKSKPKPDEYPY